MLILGTTRIRFQFAHEMDFTFKKYDEIVSAISRNGVPCFRVVDWICEQPQRGICIRHDVDRKASNALSFAHIEKDSGIQSTYYFRITDNSYDESVISQIDSMGHEIGYHYEDLALAGGDYARAKKLFAEHLDRLRQVACIKTIAMHGRPLSPFDSRDLWKQLDLAEFNLVGEAFLTIDYSDVLYITDTGRSWSANSMILRDRVQSDIDSDITSSDELIRSHRQRGLPQSGSGRTPRTLGRQPSSLDNTVHDKAINGAKRIIGMSRELLGNS